MKPTHAIAIAGAVASLFALGCGAQNNNPNDNNAIVKCQGINECAGQSACQGTLPDGGMHSCQGMNACKGQGWLEVTKQECTAKGGTVI